MTELRYYNWLEITHVYNRAQRRGEPVEIMANYFDRFQREMERYECDVYVQIFAGTYLENSSVRVSDALEALTLVLQPN